jgi:hypothetical protein
LDDDLAKWQRRGLIIFPLNIKVQVLEQGLLCFTL